MNIIKRLFWNLKCEKIENDIKNLDTKAEEISKEFFNILGEDFVCFYYGLRSKVVEVSKNYNLQTKAKLKQMLDDYASSIIAFINDKKVIDFKNKGLQLLENETNLVDIKNLKFDINRRKRAIIANQTKFNKFVEIFNKINAFCGMSESLDEISSVINEACY